MSIPRDTRKGISFPYKSRDPQVKDFQNRMREVSQMIRNAADTVAILETSWVSHFSKEDIEQLRGHLLDVGREVDRIIGKAARDLPGKPVRSTPKKVSGLER